MAHNLLTHCKNSSRAEAGQFLQPAALEAAGIGTVSRLPVSIRIVLESVLRNCDGVKVTEEHVRQLASGSLAQAAPTRFLRRRACRAAGSPAFRARRLAAMRNVPPRWEDAKRSSRWYPSIWSSITQSWLTLRHQRRARSDMKLEFSAIVSVRFMSGHAAVDTSAL